MYCNLVVRPCARQLSTTGSTSGGSDSSVTCVEMAWLTTGRTRPGPQQKVCQRSPEIPWIAPSCSDLLSRLPLLTWFGVLAKGAVGGTVRGTRPKIWPHETTSLPPVKSGFRLLQASQSCTISHAVGCWPLKPLAYEAREFMLKMRRRKGLSRSPGRTRGTGRPRHLPWSLEIIVASDPPSRMAVALRRRRVCAQVLR